VFFVLAVLATLVPVIGGLVVSLFWPVFVAGLMLGARDQDRGEPFRVGHLFAGFSNNTGQLVMVGLLYLLGGLLVFILIAAGCMVLPMKSFGEFQPRAYQNLCCFLAILSALGVTGYTIVDDEALRQLRQLPGTPFSPIEGTLIYMVLEGISCSIWQAIFVLCDPRERKNIPAVFKTGRSAAAITGIGIYLTYGLVLASMNYVVNVSYVAAFRQLSIPLGAVFGMTLLKEPRYLPKIAGIAAIFIGLVLAGIG
jgi:drug/metabolite transporter (DMT)-like permease